MFIDRDVQDDHELGEAEDAEDQPAAPVLRAWLRWR